ncbi:MAG: hypothetical protein AAGA65_04235 [Actinomycetota bacterium]
MSTSSEANPSTDRRRPGADRPTAATAGADDAAGSRVVDRSGDEAQGRHAWPLPERPGQTASPGAEAERAERIERVVAAAPDLEIVVEPEPHDWSEPVGSSGAREPTEGNSVQPTDEPRGHLPTVLAESGPLSPVVNDSGVKAVVRFLTARIDPAEAAQYLVEHRRPLLWLWRRTVGMAFAYVLISVTWFLVKLPDALVADTTIPSQVQVVAAANELRVVGVAGATLGAHVGSSLFRFATGLGAGAAIGIIVGMLYGSSPLVRTIVDPVNAFLRMVPGFAAAPLLLVWFGIGEVGLISAVAFTTLWVVMAAVSDRRIESVRYAGHGPEAAGLGTQDHRRVDQVFAAVRLAVLVTWTTTLAMETVAASTGLGAMVWFAQGRSDLVVAGIVVIGAIGFCIDGAVRLTHYLLTHARSAPMSASDLAVAPTDARDRRSGAGRPTTER